LELFSCLRGTFSVVKLAVHKSTGKLFAIKIIDKNKFCRDEKSQEQIKREIQILSEITHPNIVSYKGLYESMCVCD
jgi:serine/threonine/tyrosine protein kinase RAD53